MLQNFTTLQTFNAFLSALIKNYVYKFALPDFV